LEGKRTLLTESDVRTIGCYVGGIKTHVNRHKSKRNSALGGNVGNNARNREKIKAGQ